MTATVTEVKTLSDEEMKAATKQIHRQLAKTIFVRTAVVLSVVVVTAYVTKKLDSKMDVIDNIAE